MELFCNRKLLLVNEDEPIITTTSLTPLPHNQDSKPTTTPPHPTTPFKRSLQLPQHPLLTSNVAYTFLILFTAFFFLAFILLSIRRFLSRRRSHHPSCHGVDLAAGKSLPVCPYNEDTKQGECVICLEEFLEGDLVKMLPYCKHVFHPSCIDTWLASHVTCPVCRCGKLCGEIVDERSGGGSTVENGGH